MEPIGDISRSISVETRVLDAKRGTVRYVASDPSIDSYGEIIDPAGWKFDLRWNTNPVFVNSHNYSSIAAVLGKGIRAEVTRAGKLAIDVQWAIDVPENTAAIMGFKMVAAGYLPACSVGFRPVDYAFPWGDPKKWDATLKYAVDKFKLDAAQIAKVEGIYLEQQLVELSACVIGANPAALAEAYKDGALSEEDLSKLSAYAVRGFKQISAVTQPRLNSGPVPHASPDGTRDLARAEDVALLREFTRVAERTPSQDDLLSAMRSLA